MISKLVLLIIAGIILFFWPECFERKDKISSKRIIAYIIFLIVGISTFFVFKIDKIWLFILAGGKVSILNLYEVCQMVLETEDERDMERARRIKLYLKSLVICIVLNMYLII